jgi:hypothetical protein
MSTDASSDKPKSVQRAVVCLWISVGLALIVTGAPFIGLLDSPDIVTATITNLVTAGFLALVAAKIGAGRGWARWLFAVVYILGSFAGIVSLLVAPQMFRSSPPILQGSGILQFALQTAAFVLMFTSTSRQWFKAKRVEPAPLGRTDGP